MAAPTVYVDGAEVSIVCVEEAHLVFDMDALYATGLLVLKDPAGSLLNTIKRGSEVLILYESTSGKSLIKHPMRVLSFTKEGSREAATMDRTRAVLISEWYYRQISKTRAFFGTVSQITAAVLDDDRWFSRKHIETSTDSTRIRYQISQKNADYLSRMKRYAVASGSAMFMFTNRRREFQLISKQTIKNDTPKYRLIPFLDIKDETKGNSGLPVVSALALAFYSEGENASGLKVYKIPTRNATAQEQVAAMPLLELPSLEATRTEAVRSFTVDNVSLSDWTLSPAEAAACATNEFEREEHELFYGVAVVNNILATSLDLASVVEVDLSRDCAENGIYFIKHMDLIYNKGQSFTKLMLLRR